MSESFGARLRRRREEQRIDLIAIAAQTKIKSSLLEALERDDVRHWPSGIFRRAYVRAYAQAIGLDPDLVLREFLQRHPEPSEVVTTEALASAVQARVSGAPPIRLRHMVGSAFSSLARLRRPVQEDSRQPNSPAGLPHGSGTPDPDAEDDGSSGPFAAPEREHADCAAPQPELPVGEAVSPEAVPDGRAAAAIDFPALAHLCTRFGLVQDSAGLRPLLEDASRVLRASGLVLWLWDSSVDGLRAALSHGYSERVIAELPIVGREHDSATAAALRSAATCCTSGDDHTNGALAVPLLTAAGCAGVLAIEVPRGCEQDVSVRAGATILAAMLAQLAVVPAAASEDSALEGAEDHSMPRSRGLAGG